MKKKPKNSSPKRRNSEFYFLYLICIYLIYLNRFFILFSSIIFKNIFLIIYTYINFRIYFLIAPPYGKTKRIRWSEEEKHALFKYFGNILELPQLPSLQECQNAITKYKILKKRQPQQVKTWIDNQRKAENRHKEYQISNLK